MKHERATEEMRHQSALYALGLLTQHEAHCFELHMEDCQVCRVELAKLLLASTQIGLAVNEENPPEGLRERLAARIDSSLRDIPLPVLPEKQESAPASPPAEPVKTPKPAKKAIFVAAAAPMPPPRSRKAAFFIHAIIYAVIVVLGAYAFYLWQNIKKEKFELQNRIEAAETNQADLLRQLESQRENVEKLERFQNLFHNPSVRIARLKGQTSSLDHTGAVIWNSVTGDVTVICTLDPAPAGMVYRLWLSSPTEKISVGRLPSDRNGRILTVVKFNHDSLASSSGVTAIVTLESEKDLSIRTESATPWIASGRVE